ncbi:MAG TPA: hypothetical protein VER58_05340 [Thermoanaerobaculia bacterium]|nr:hypothetical protein [Thermoanaerobaculia bacterium]
MRAKKWIVGACSILLLGLAWAAYPIYPAMQSLCGLADDRAKCVDRWASPHRGAVHLLNGDLYGTSEDVYGFRARVKRR